MTWYLVEDVELLKLRMAQKAHKDLFVTEDEKQLQKRLKKENELIAKQRFADTINDICKRPRQKVIA